MIDFTGTSQDSNKYSIKFDQSSNHQDLHAPHTKKREKKRSHNKKKNTNYQALILEEYEYFF
jgi:hypothetical protein